MKTRNMITPSSFPNIASTTTKRDRDDSNRNNDHDESSSNPSQSLTKKTRHITRISSRSSSKNTSASSTTPNAAATTCSPSRKTNRKRFPFPKGALRQAAYDGNDVEVQRLLALCSSKAHVDDEKKNHMFAFEISVANEDAKTAQLIWQRYRDLGCNLTEILDDALCELSAFPYISTVAGCLNTILPFCREEFGDDESIQIKIQEKLQAAKHTAKFQEDMLRRLFPSNASSTARTTTKRDRDGSNSNTYHDKSSLSPSQPSAKKTRYITPSSSPTKPPKEANTNDERKPAPAPAPAGVARKRASSSTTSATPASSHHYSVRSLLCLLEDDLNIDDCSGGSMDRLIRVKVVLLGEDDEDSVPASLSVVRQLAEMARLLGVNTDSADDHGAEAEN